jgi:hypothetical protein
MAGEKLLQPVGIQRVVRVGEVNVGADEVNGSASDAEAVVAERANDADWFVAKLARGRPGRVVDDPGLRTVPQPFLDLEIATGRIASRLYRKILSDPNPWAAWLTREGLGPVKAFPVVDVSQILRHGKLTVGFDSDALVVINAVRMGRTDSTFYTAISSTTMWMEREGVARQMRTGQDAFSRPGERGYDVFTGTLWSNSYLGPAMSSIHGLVLPLDLYSFVLLATQDLPNPQP